MYRKTYVEVNLKNIRNNVNKIISFLTDYKYYFGVVKADSYGHYGYEPVKSIIEGGANYLAVSSLEEALEIRKYNKDISILCLGIIDLEYLDVCEENNITITISNKEYAYRIDKSNVKVHFKINTGMNRLGFSNNKDFIDSYNYLKDRVNIEGIYTHIYNDESIEDTNNQIKKFEEITNGVDLKSIPIVHFGGSNFVLNYSKLDYVNGARLGIIMYGLTNNDLNLESTFRLFSKVIQINEVDSGTVGYCGNHKVNGKERIAVIPIGYADGIIRKNTGRTVYINDKEYEIVGNVCMDMLFVKVDENVKIKDNVLIIKDINDIIRISNYLGTIPYEIICGISKRVPRIYI